MTSINIQYRKSTKVKNEDFSFYISFDYRKDIVSNIKTLPLRFYNPTSKEWEVPVSSLGTVIDMFRNEHIIYEGPAIVQNEFVEEEEEDVDDVQFVTKPYEHQVEGVKFGLKHKKFLLADQQGLGKALSLDTKIYTPDGYRPIKDIHVGDLVFNELGEPVSVLAEYSHDDLNMYEVTFSDNKSVLCCEDHLWQIKAQGGTKIVDTGWFTDKNHLGKIRNLYTVKTGYQYHIPRCLPVQFNPQEIKLSPYVLGCLLGDGGLSTHGIGFTNSELEIIENIQSQLPDGYHLNSSPSMKDISYHLVKKDKDSWSRNIVVSYLKEIGLMGKNSHTKFIPNCYKYNSIENRLEVIRGLLDTDGYATKDNLLQYTTVSKQLADDMEFMIESIGGLAVLNEAPCGYDNKITGVAYTITIRVDDPTKLVTLSRKRDRLKRRKFKPRRSIKSVVPAGKAPGKCITVSGKSSLYLCDHFIVTHNTKQVIDIATAKKDKTSKTLIITGVASLKWNWLKEIGIHSYESGHVLGMRVNTKGKLTDKGNKARVEDLKGIKDIDAYFIITNIESLRNKDVQKEISKLTAGGTLNICAIDEIHRGGGKNGQASAGKAIHKIKSEYKIALTGTPLVNKPLDLYNIFKWLGHEKRSFYAFRNRYCEMGGFKGYEVVGYKNMEELKDKVGQVQLRRLKEDVLDLPEKIRSTDFVELTGKQKQAYKSVQRELRDQLDEIMELDNPLAKMLRLRQVTSYPKLIKEDVKENVKLDRLRQLIGENVKNGEKTIVYSNWTQITKMLAEELSECNPAYIVGGSDTQEEIQKFQEDDSCKIIIGTIGAMGTGITLTKANNIIFYDRPWNFSTVEQAEDRAHRIGTTKNVNIVSLVVKDSIDEVVEEIINTKKDLSDLLVDGKLENLSKYDLVERILE